MQHIPWLGQEVFAVPEFANTHGIMEAVMVEQTITIEQVLSDHNLLQAWYKVRANKGCAGIDRETIADFKLHLMAGLALLRDEVWTGRNEVKFLEEELAGRSGTGQT